MLQNSPICLQQNEENKKKNKLAALKAANELEQAKKAGEQRRNSASDLGESTQDGSQLPSVSAQDSNLEPMQRNFPLMSKS